MQRRRELIVRDFWRKHEHRWKSHLEGHWISQEEAVRIQGALMEQNFVIKIGDIESRYAQNLAPAKLWPKAKDRAGILRTATYAIEGKHVPSVRDAATWTFQYV